MTTKLTFAEMQNKVQAEKNNADLENLARALEYISVGRIELKKAFDRAMSDMEEVEADITATALMIENGDIAMVDDIRKLYEKARKVSSVNL